MMERRSSYSSSRSHQRRLPPWYLPASQSWQAYSRTSKNAPGLPSFAPSLLGSAQSTCHQVSCSARTSWLENSSQRFRSSRAHLWRSRMRVQSWGKLQRSAVSRRLSTRTLCYPFKEQSWSLDRGKSPRKVRREALSTSCRAELAVSYLTCRRFWMSTGGESLVRKWPRAQQSQRVRLPSFWQCSCHSCTRRRTTLCNLGRSFFPDRLLATALFVQCHSCRLCWGLLSWYSQSEVERCQAGSTRRHEPIPAVLSLSMAGELSRSKCSDISRTKGVAHGRLPLERQALLSRKMRRELARPIARQLNVDHLDISERWLSWAVFREELPLHSHDQWSIRLPRK